MPLTNQDARRFAELRDSGLLWLINRVVFHPRGLALALHADEAGALYGWSLLPSPDGGPWTYPEDTEPGHYRSAEATLAAAHGRPVRPDDDARPPSHPAPDGGSGRSVHYPALGTPSAPATSADVVRPGADAGADERRAEVRRAITTAFLDDDSALTEVAGLTVPDEDGRPTRIIPAGELTLGPDGLTDVERQRKTIRDTLNTELSHADAGPAWDLTLSISRALDAMPRYATHEQEQPHPAVTWWWSAYERAQAAEVRLSAVRDVIADMEHTTGARQWARLLAHAVGEPVQDDEGTWRRRAVRRSLALSRAHGLITAVCDLAHETARPAGPLRADGYRQALDDLRAVLVAFGHLPDEKGRAGADLVHSCQDPQARGFVEVDGEQTPVVHSAHRPTKQEGTR
ncbi:hypothetical protein ACQPXT_13640 [Streptomyces sp. CA-100214]